MHSGEFVDSLGLHIGNTIADVGTGVGHLLPYIRGTIFAVNINPEFLDKVRERIAVQAGGTCIQCSARSALRSCPQNGSTEQLSSIRITT